MSHFTTNKKKATKADSNSDSDLLQESRADYAPLPFKRMLLVGLFLSKHGGSWSPTEGLAENLRRSGVTTITTSSQKRGILRGVDVAATLCLQHTKFDYAVVDFYSHWAFAWAELSSLMLRGLGKKMVAVLHGGDLVEHSTRWPQRTRTALAWPHVVATPSLRLKKHFEEFLSRPVIYLPNGIDLSHFVGRVRRTVDPRLIWIRRFHDIYRPEMAIRVVEKLAKCWPHVKLTMIGEDSGDGSKGRCERLARQLQISHAIDFAGAVAHQEVPHWLARHDIFLNTTSIESFGVSVQEAAACGLCIVTTRAGELPFLWTHNENALLVDIDDCRQMANAVAQLLTDVSLSQRLSKNAIDASQRFSQAATWRSWRAMLQALT